MGAFFVIGFPIVMGLFFGLVMRGTSSGSRGPMNVQLVDLDRSEWSQRLIDEMQRGGNVTLVATEAEAAREQVRLGKSVALLVIPAGFGESAGKVWQPQPELQLGVDPSRAAEAAMLEGFVMQAMGGLIGQRFQNPSDFLPDVRSARQALEQEPQLGEPSRLLVDTFLGSLEAMLQSADRLQQDPAGDGELGNSIQLANVRRVDVTESLDPASVRGQMKKIRSPWDISFPQAMLWGVLGCIAGFAASLARTGAGDDRPAASRAAEAAGSSPGQGALACFLTALFVIVMMSILGGLLGMRPHNPAQLAVVASSVGFAFVGVMMVMAVLGRTEQAVAGSGWAINMVMAMIGGCMIPVMFMPQFLQLLSVFSPVHWALCALEGAIWRQFSWAELAAPCGVLAAIGCGGLLVGSAILARRHDL